MQGLTEPELTAKLQKLLTPTEAAQLEYTWRFWARPSQLAPEGEWFIWLILTGRGWGKTRTAAEYVRSRIERGEWRRVALVNDTAWDARHVMVEGQDGILAITPSGQRPTFEPSKAKLTWPNGAVAFLYGAEAPERLRGPQHDGAWCDEPTKWRNLRKTDDQGGTAWDNLMFGLRTGDDPRCIVGCTPRYSTWLRKLLNRTDIALTRGSIYENVANLAPQFLREMERTFEGTRLGRQELGGEIMDDVPGALWTRKMLDSLRVTEAPDLIRIVVAIDPAMTSGEDADETGIVAAGKGPCRCKGEVEDHAFILHDSSGHYTPSAWAQSAIELLNSYEGDRIIGEVNNGGEMVEHTLRTVDSTVPYKAVHATRGKRVRAEPIAALYEQGKVHHVGMFAAMEDQMCNFTPDGYDGSPDRLDAAVWALTELDLHASWVVA